MSCWLITMESVNSAALSKAVLKVLVDVSETFGIGTWSFDHKSALERR